MAEVQTKETVKSFINKVLAGTAIAIVVALIPNAILATVLRPFPNNQFAMDFLRIVQVFQFFTPIMAGMMIGLQFNLTAMQMLAVGGASYIGSGAWRFVEVVMNDTPTNIFQLAGIGDLINTMITAALAVWVIQKVGHKFGSLNIILLPILVGTGVGYIGWLLLPYVSYITTLIGQGINAFTELQPILMCALISISFALLIVSPISTVAIGIAIGLNGLSSAAAAMGVASTAAFLVWGTIQKNKAGVPLAIGLGAMKMMMPNFLNNLIMAVPIAISAAICSLSVPIFGLVGTPASAGFGLVGLVGPIASLEGAGVSILIMLLTWGVIPFGVTYVVNKVCQDVLKLYSSDIFIFEG